jgi:putative SOS response-associated peptidase YedK
MPPSQELLVIRRNHKTGEVSLDPLRWDLIPYWRKNRAGGRKPINAKYETVRDLPTFCDAYRVCRCIVPVDGFFEWKAIKGQKAKQPYAIAMKAGAPFGIAGIWENWKEPASGEFAIITTDSNEFVADIHHRKPVILAPADYACWLGEEPDPRDLMRPFPADLMRMWPIATRVNKAENDDPQSLSRSNWQPMLRRNRIGNRCCVGDDEDPEPGPLTKGAGRTAPMSRLAASIYEKQASEVLDPSRAARHSDA